jgi:hypothetical protein
MDVNKQEAAGFTIASENLFVFRSHQGPHFPKTQSDETLRA